MKKPCEEISVTAVIMARTESTRCPRKLIRDFGDTTLIDIALAKLNKMDFVDHRLLAVAEDVFIEKLKEYPSIELYKRSNESVAKGHVPLKVRYEHYFHIKTDYVLFFNPCHPFITLEVLKNATEIVKDEQHNSFTSVVSSKEWVFDHEGNPLTNKDPKKTVTNEGLPRSKAAHAFHFIRPEFFVENGMQWTFTKNDPSLIWIPEEEALDVDTELEFTLCEILYRQKKINS